MIPAMRTESVLLPNGFNDTSSSHTCTADGHCSQWTIAVGEFLYGCCKEKIRRIHARLAARDAVVADGKVGPDMHELLHSGLDNAPTSAMYLF